MAAPPNQSLRRRAFCKVFIGTEDVTSHLDPHLISIQVVDKMNELDTCNIELDDRDGRLAIPAANVIISVLLGWASTGPKIDEPAIKLPPGSDLQLGWGNENIRVVFRGVVHSVESGFARGSGGRRLWIEAVGANLFNDGKTPMMFSMGDGEEHDTNGGSTGQIDPGGSIGGGGVGSGGTPIPFLKFMQKIGEMAGYGNIKLAPDVGDLERNFWFQNSSFHDTLMKYSKELGFKFKITGDTVMGFAAGSPDFLPTEFLEAHWGINLISWRIKPFTGRPMFGQGKQVWYDSVNSIWKNVTKEIGGTGPFADATATAQLPAAAPNRQVGGQNVYSAEQDSEQRRGTGWAIINGEPRARANSFLNIEGARQGVDGSYLIEEAEHNYTRAGGYITRCTLGRPEHSSTAGTGSAL